MKNNKFIVEQAVDFDKLPWNRKERNFALFWPVVLWAFYVYVFIKIIMADMVLDDRKFAVIIWFWLTFGTSLIYLAFKNYVQALIAIPLIMIFEDIIFCIIGNEYSILRLFLEVLFIIPIKIELYRRKHGLSKPKNIKKDIVIGIILALVFPALWLLSALWR